MTKQDQPQFSAILTPYRSLSPQGFLIVMGLIGGISFITGLMFYALGAWPVAGFLGLDVLIVYIAFKLNYRSGRLYETVEIIGDDLKVMRIFPSGKSQSWHFNPYWARVLVEQNVNRSTTLHLFTHQQKLVFGQFLTDDEKQDFAEALHIALRNYRTMGGRRSS